MRDLLFVYGTLHPNCAPLEIGAAAGRLISIGPATIHGHLYDLGQYPGVILDTAATTTILGELFTVPDAGTLAALDAYEDFRANDLANSLFVRVATTASMPDGSYLACWIYVYNRGVNDREPSNSPQS